MKAVVVHAAVDGVVDDYWIIAGAVGWLLHLFLALVL